MDLMNFLLKLDPYYNLLLSLYNIIINGYSFFQFFIYIIFLYRLIVEYKVNIVLYFDIKKNKYKFYRV